MLKEGILPPFKEEGFDPSDKSTYFSEEEFNEFIKYHLSTCERKDILGASAHTLDILKKNQFKTNSFYYTYLLLS